MPRLGRTISHCISPASAGWAGFIKWRADQSEYEWQTAYPIDSVQYLAVRLWYERELVLTSLPQKLRHRWQLKSISAHLRHRPGRIPPSHRRRYWQTRSLIAAWRLTALARALELEPALLTQTQHETLPCCSTGSMGFLSQHGPVWLKAFEAGYQEQLLEKLGFKIGRFGPPRWRSEPRA